MKKAILKTIDLLYQIIETLLALFLYGKHKQQKDGWRGKYAKLLSANRLKPYNTIERYQLLDRLQAIHPELIKSSKSLLKWSYVFRFCQSILGSRMDDWLSYKMYKKGWVYRFNCMSFWRNKFFNDYVNQRELGYTDILDNKTEFASYWKDFFCRKWCEYDPDVEFDLDSFLTCFKGKKIIIKRLDGYGGENIKVFSSEQLLCAYEYITKSTKKLIIEEYINQTGLLHDLNPSSLNTIRVCTLQQKGEPTVLFAKLRVGRKGEMVDNACAGGSLFDIDVKSGYLINGSDYNGQEISLLPNLQPITDFKVPRWDEVKEYCIKAHKYAPGELNLIGWDVCVSNDFMCMVEGNANPAYGMFPNDIKKPWKFARQYLDEFDLSKNNS